MNVGKAFSRYLLAYLSWPTRIQPDRSRGQPVSSTTSVQLRHHDYSDVYIWSIFWQLFCRTFFVYHEIGHQSRSMVPYRCVGCLKSSTAYRRSSYDDYPPLVVRLSCVSFTRARGRYSVKRLIRFVYVFVPCRSRTVRPNKGGAKQNISV